MSDDYVIRELKPELLDDYLRFFDTDAFADNPQWASCYCYFPQAPHETEKWTDRTGEQNRADVCRLIERGEMQGYLAFHEGRAVAWCNAAPRTRMTILDEVAEAEQIGSIVCFVVAKAHRGRGVARKLLEAALAGFKEQGLPLAEGYPRRDAHDEASSHFGPLSMFLSAGFAPHTETEGNTVVRKDLTAETQSSRGGNAEG